MNMAEPVAPPTTSSEERIARIEGIVEQMHHRLVSLENGQVQMRSELTTKIDNNYQALLDKIDSTFHWTIGIMLTTWVTLAALIIGVLLQR
jgi:C4-type Zn-finger protein